MKEIKSISVGENGVHFAVSPEHTGITHIIKNQKEHLLSNNENYSQDIIVYEVWKADKLYAEIESNNSLTIIYK